MTLLRSLQKLLGKAPVEQTPPAKSPPAAAAEPEPEIVIPEWTAKEVMALRQDGKELMLLDCREDYERKQVRIPGSLHIPMNQTPGRMAELDPDSEIVVVCAHGNRSYGVAGYLIQNGFKAHNLKGGMAVWQREGGEIESDYRTR
ncbi:MAG: rhodanese-like domain-containing protein [Caldilineales bacterium]|nr:rhodanese-like domain-containing protein [Caldilineales bacterium]